MTAPGGEAREIDAARGLGVAVIALAVAFNVPFSALGALYDYPHVLRRPAGEALDLFAAGGPILVIVWHGFMLCALALTLIAPALAITRQRLSARPALAIGAALAGGLAGLIQAVGLSRWVFAVPALARLHADPSASSAARLGAEQSFDILNAWGGVAIGEHLGQLLTAAFVLQVAALQRAEGAKIAGRLGGLASIAMIVGTGEGLAVALGRAGDVFALVTIAGFVGLTLWLIATGLGLIRTKAAAK